MEQKPAAGRGKERRIGKLIVLPWSKAIEISINSLRIRFWRSSITTGGIVLAIAFLMAMLTKSTVVAALKTVQDPNVAIAIQKAGEDVGAGQGPSTERWLMALALLVALVGITNAQLMSVTERFREIGTMKCLGALDSFVVRLFVLESAFQGMTGTLIGIVVGYALMSLKLWRDYRTVWSAGGFAYPWGGVLCIASICMVVGTGLSVLAAIYPAYVAAKMEPVVAMRADQ